MQINNTTSLQSFRPSNTLSRFKDLIYYHHTYLFILCALGCFGGIFVSLRQTATYTSTATLQIQQLNLASTARNFSGFDFSAEQDIRMRIENSAELFKSDILAARVEERVRKHSQANSLIFATFFQDIFATPKLMSPQRVSPSDLRASILKMIVAKSDASKNNIYLTVTSYSPLTTKVILALYVEEFNRLTQEKMMERIEQSSVFFKEQLVQSRKKLLEAEENLSQFIQKNPFLHSDTSRVEFVRLRERRQEIIDDLAAKGKIINYHREQINEIKRTTSKSLNAVRFKLQNEIEQLEYDRLKYLSEGYNPKHPGIVKLDQRIASLKSTIENQLDNKAARNVAMETDVNDRIKEISDKILSLEDEIESKKISINNLDDRIKNLSPSFQKLPEREATYNRLKRDADVASQLYLQLSNHVNLMNIRTASETGNWTLISDPSDPSSPLGVIPLFQLLLFGIMFGFSVGISSLLIRDTLDPKLISRDDVESLGFIYCGKISNLLAEQAQVLSRLELIGSQKSNDKSSVITFASPDSNCNISSVLNLISYLSSQNKTSLTIVLGDFSIPHEYGAPVSIGYANIYRHHDGKRDIVHVSDKDTFVSLQSLIQSSEKKYSAIFLLLKDAINNPSFALALNISDKLLLVGSKHRNSLSKYYELTRGFQHKSEIYFAFSLTPKELFKLELQNEYYGKMYGKNTVYINKINNDSTKSVKEPLEEKKSA